MQRCFEGTAKAVAEQKCSTATAVTAASHARQQQQHKLISVQIRRSKSCKPAAATRVMYTTDLFAKAAVRPHLDKHALPWWRCILQRFHFHLILVTTRQQHLL
jgi:hypothetical protein